MSNSATTSFWNFLNQTAICIPIIQRDYAQGRSGKEELRKRFLGALKDALKNQETLKLDFAYGTFSNSTFYPLDGQQRLTTLWLLHWYIAYKADKLKEAEATLQKFSYATRVSAREFCNKLCTLAQIPEGISNILKHITNQNWFYSAWLQDPTIQSMLRMISDTESKTGIVELIKHDNYSDAWTWLTSPDCKLEFQVLNIASIGQTDDLYVKMNARGKTLTSFENFKAELVNYIHTQIKDEKNPKQEQEQWQALDSPDDGFGQKLDNAWTDIFWKLRSQDSSDIKERQCHIDEIFFAFFNRFFFNEQAIIAGNDWNKLPLYGNNGDDTRLNFASLERYKDNNDEISLERFQEIEKILDRLPALHGYSEFNTAFSPLWMQNDKFFFLPEYFKDTNGKLVIAADYDQNEILQITRITVKQRAVFFAIGKWLLMNSPIDDGKQMNYSSAQLTAFKDWMRVIWNIVENSEIGNDLPGALKLIDELAAHSDHILEFLASDAQVQSIFARTQMAEERRKAKLICANAGQSPNPWYLKIKEAEALPFLKGRLAVLLEASREDIRAFVKCIGHCLANLGLCEDKLDPNAKGEKMLAFFRSYLPYAQDCDLPLEYDHDFFNLDKWKSMFFRDTNKNGVIAWLKSFVDEQVPKNITDWAANLREHWNEFFPEGPNEYRGLVMYRCGWGNNKVFLYRTRNISGAQLISKSLRTELFEGLYGAAVPWNYHYRGYDLGIELKNGLKIVHRPDDTVAVCHNNEWLNKIGDFSLSAPLTPDTLKDFIRNCNDYPANCSPVK